MSDEIQDQATDGKVTLEGSFPASESGITQESLQALLNISHILGSILEGPALLRKILEIAVETVNAERGFLVLIEDGKDFDVAASHNLSEQAAGELARPSGSILQRAISECRPLLVHDAQTDPRFQGSESLMLNQITSAIVVPLIQKDTMVGRCVC